MKDPKIIFKVWDKGSQYEYTNKGEHIISLDIEFQSDDDLISTTSHELQHFIQQNSETGMKMKAHMNKKKWDLVTNKGMSIKQVNDYLHDKSITEWDAVTVQLLSDIQANRGEKQVIEREIEYFKNIKSYQKFIRDCFNFDITNK